MDGGVAAINAIVPASGISKMISNPSAGNLSYWGVQIGDNTLGNGNDTMFDGLYNGWCADNDRTIGTGTFHSSNFYSTYELGTLPAGIVDIPANLDLVNWIINQDFVGQSAGALGTYTYGDVQEAIWQLIEDTYSTASVGSFSQARVDQIKAAAGTHDGFEPGLGQDVALLVVPYDSAGTPLQSVIIEYTMGDRICNEVSVDTNETPIKSDGVCTELTRLPLIDIEKYVDVGTGYEDADQAPGQALVPGWLPDFKFEVTNTGNVTLTGITVTDDVFDLNGLADDASADAGYQYAGSLAPNASFFIELLDQTPISSGNHVDTGTATSAQGATDSDEAHYYVLNNNGMITNSSFCTFDTNPNVDGDQFNLIYTPAFNVANNVYKLSDSNPGQFYYHVWTADSGGTITMEIPYPFVTVGGNPIHVYYGAPTPVEGANGQECLDYSQLTGFTGFTTSISYDAEGDMIVTLTGVPDNTPITANIHLDFGEEKQNFTRSGEDAIQYQHLLGNIADNTEYNFDAAFGSGSLGDTSNAEDTIFNDNLFKKANGFMGFAKDLNGAGTEDDLFAGGMKVQIVTKATGKLAWTGTTDADGWYYGSFFATGKATAYKITADTNKNGVFDNGDTTFESTLGGATKYAQVDFFGDWPGQGS